VGDTAGQWAKAPSAPSARERAEEATRADRWDQLTGGLAPVRCAVCSVVVLVKKNSVAHTSIQWNPAALRGCAEFTGARADGQDSALIATCRSLVASVEGAVRDGVVRVPGGDVDVPARRSDG
jgi:hypothetical protein